jgi:hypothetical protein
MCGFKCCVSFDRGVILCDVLFVCCILLPLPPDKNPFTVKINNNKITDINTTDANLLYTRKSVRRPFLYFQLFVNTNINMAAMRNACLERRYGLAVLLHFDK